MAETTGKRYRLEGMRIHVWDATERRWHFYSSHLSYRDAISRLLFLRDEGADIVMPRKDWIEAVKQDAEQALRTANADIRRFNRALEALNV